MTKIIQIFQLFGVFCLLIGLMGCKDENPNPELLDPIYNDLVKAHKELEKAVKDEGKNYEKLVGELAKTKPRTVSRTTAKNDVRKSKKKLFYMTQELKYLTIRKERRRVEGRRAYKIAFRNDKEWPDPKEYEAYKTYNRLKNASLNWNERVPKLDKNNPNFRDPKNAGK